VSRWVAIGSCRNTFANSRARANFNGVTNLNTNTDSHHDSHAKTDPHTNAQQAQELQHSSGCHQP
jgi:hypothetical protein